MQTWVTYVTLVSYLIGGWLIPSTHHHAAHAGRFGCALPHATCCSIQSGVHSNRTHEVRSTTSCAGKSIQRCKHGNCAHHVPAIVSANASDSRSTSVQDESRSHSNGGDHSLCSICIAQTMAAIGIAIYSLLYSNPVDDLFRVGAPDFLVLEAIGLRFSRGPPVFV